MKRLKNLVLVLLGILGFMVIGYFIYTGVVM